MNFLQDFAFYEDSISLDIVDVVHPLNFIPKQLGKFVDINHLLDILLHELDAALRVTGVTRSLYSTHCELPTSLKISDVEDPLDLLYELTIWPKLADPAHPSHSSFQELMNKHCKFGSYFGLNVYPDSRFMR